MIQSAIESPELEDPCRLQRASVLVGVWEKAVGHDLACWLVGSLVLDSGVVVAAWRPWDMPLNESVE